MIQIVPATMEHARAIDLREGDAREVLAYGIGKEAAIAQSLARALWAETWLIDGVPAAIGGLSVSSVAGGYGMPWLLTGPACERHKKTFMIATRRQVARMRAEKLPLVNWVHADYGRAVRWLAWLGFTVDALPAGAAFRRFHMGLDPQPYPEEASAHWIDQSKPHPEEPGIARRLEGWATGAVRVPITGRRLLRPIRDGAARLLRMRSNRIDQGKSKDESDDISKPKGLD